ncbi:hypothetical protein M405DRAFT_628857 [Rhizopogon salebrosus TDB-379]|nr:hypothetical protein M405DRAFT_628857 [Rhizopogon salebrosus TDB-379]
MSRPPRPSYSVRSTTRSRIRNTLRSPQRTAIFQAPWFFFYYFNVNVHLPISIHVDINFWVGVVSDSRKLQLIESSDRVYDLLYFARMQQMFTPHPSEPTLPPPL